MTKNFASVIFAKSVYNKVDKQKTLLTKFEPRKTHSITNEGNLTAYSTAPVLEPNNAPVKWAVSPLP
jgi:hypothetical protein